MVSTIKKDARKMLCLFLALSMLFAPVFQIVTFAAEGDNTYTATVENGITGGILELRSTMGTGSEATVVTGAAVTVSTGAAVTVTVIPDTGKRLVDGSLKYTPDGGAAVVIPVSNNMGSFSMQEADVTVTAQFTDSIALPVLTNVTVNGSEAVLDYMYEHNSIGTIWGLYRVKGTTEWNLSQDGATSGTTITIENLKSATTYEFSLLLYEDSTEKWNYADTIFEKTTDKIDVTGLSLNKETEFARVGGTVQLEATVAPDDASNESVIWRSENEDVATVSVSGLVTGISAGTVNIVATTVDQNFTASCEITVVSGPATGVTSVLSVSTSGGTPIDSGKELYAKPGETITLKLEITATGGGAYGFATGLQYDSNVVQFIDDSFVGDNPNVDKAVTQSGASTYIWLSHDSNGQDMFLKKDEPFLITLKFKFPNMTMNSTNMIFGGSTQNNRLQLLASPDLRLADLRDQTGAFLAANSVSEGILEKTVRYASQVWCRLRATPKASIALTAIDGSNVGRKVGESVKTKLTITSDQDVYGFVTHVQYSGTNGFLVLDTSAWETDNPGIPQVHETLIKDGVIRVSADSDGETKIIEAGQSRDIVLRFKVTNMIATNTPLYSELIGCVFTDPSVLASALYEGNDSLVWNAKIVQAETDGKVDVVNSIYSYPGFPVTGAYSAAVEFGNGKEDEEKKANVIGIAGPGSPDIEMTATITPPDGKALYGFSTAISYYGYYFMLDEAATKARNAEYGLTVGFLESEYTDTSYTWQPSTRQIYVESNGTKLINPGETLTFKLVFKPKATAAVTNSPVTVITTLNGNRMVLFTAPSVRAVATGPELTTLYFGLSKIQAAEKAGLVAIAGPTPGTITTVKQLELSTDGVAYTISSENDFKVFANAVNNDGLNMIKGAVSGTITLPSDFAGIGTPEHPFVGELSGGIINISSAINSGTNPVFGGVVRYLGEGGLVRNMTVNGTITVTGVTGTVNIGGVVGISNGGSMSGITSNVNITAMGVTGNVGGIAGSASNSKYADTVTSYQYALGNCKNIGAVSGGTNTGGIAGLFSGEAGNVTNYNTIYLSSNTGAVSGSGNTGGIAGSTNGGMLKQNRNADVKYASGEYMDVDGGNIDGANAGGIAGLATGATLDNCASTGSINGSARAGGIVGYVTGGTTVDSCWVDKGTITAPAGAAGGIAGEIASASAWIANNLNLGAVTEKGIAGAASVTPAKYSGNCYISTAAGEDALGATSVSDPSLFIIVTARTSNAIGRYVYDTPGEPEQDEDGVWMLKTPADILWFARKVNSNTANEANESLLRAVDYSRMNAKLMNDIDMSGESFYGIGMNTPATAYYKGVFDGNNHTVTLNVTGTPNSFFGFFNYTMGATIKNLTIAGSINLPSTGAVAGIVATNVNNQGILTIENCNNKATITAPGASVVGGIVANGSDIRMTNCTNGGTITQKATSTNGVVGGIAGSIGGDSTINKCVNSGAVTGGSQIGGLIGLVNLSSANHNIVIAGCSNTGAVTSNTPASSNYTSTYCAGGIVGYVNSTNANSGANSSDEVSGIEISECVNSGTVSGTTNNLGGILGRTASGYAVDLVISKCVNNGNIISTFNGTNESIGATVSVGGIAGNVNLGYVPSWGDAGWFGSATDNENNGTVSGNMGSISSILGSGESNMKETTGNTTTKINSMKDQAEIDAGRLTKVDPPSSGDDNENDSNDGGNGNGSGSSTTGDSSLTGDSSTSSDNSTDNDNSDKAMELAVGSTQSIPPAVQPVTADEAPTSRPITSASQTEDAAKINFETPDADETLLDETSTEKETQSEESAVSEPHEESIEAKEEKVTRGTSKGIPPAGMMGIVIGVVVAAFGGFYLIKFLRRPGR